MLLTCRINLQCLSTQILLEFGDSGQSSLAIRQWGRGEFDDSHTYARIYYPVSMTALAIIPYDIIRNPSNGAWSISMQTGYTDTNVVFTTNTKNTIGAFGWVGIGTV